MVVGKSLTLVILLTSIARADVFNPRFDTYTSGSAVGDFLNITFGWFKKLDDEQLDRYHSSIIHALEYAELEQRVTWYSKDASGFAVPVAEWPTGSGYCRQLHIEVIAYNQRKTKSVRSCYNSMTEYWTWYKGK